MTTRSVAPTTMRAAPSNSAHQCGPPVRARVLGRTCTGEVVVVGAATVVVGATVVVVVDALVVVVGEPVVVV